MTLYDIKPYFQSLLRPLVKVLYQHGITANQVTLSALGISVALGVLLSFYPYPLLFILLPILLFLRMALNAMDGMLAREFKQQSHLGAIYNEVGDIIADVALFVPFIFLSSANLILVLTCIFLSILTEFCGVLAQTLSINSKRGYQGPLGKSDRALFLGTYAFIFVIYPNALLYINWVFGIIMILLALTCYKRCNQALKIAQASNKNEVENAG